jgi:methionyl-tRNA synthetase
MQKKHFIATSIPYVNAKPHIGHALEFVQADCLARYYRTLNEDVFFLSGTDENAQKNVASAEKEGISPQELVDKYSQSFYNFKTWLNISFDEFIRTSSEKHKKGAQAFWQRCEADIYKKKYEGYYCPGCEAFVTPKDLIEGKCPEHLIQPEKVTEENYFFRLSGYQTQLRQLIETDQVKIIPQERKNEVLGFIDQGLEDFSISRDANRTKGWGIPVPNDPTQIIYVWFDALLNYITALNFPNNSLFTKFWEDPKTQKSHVIGKGILRFHAVYWLAMLLSAKLPLPNREFVHGYVTVDGQKISKSLGNTVDPEEVVSQYGTDPVRYYLLKEINPFKDSDFSFKRFEELYNSDLANGLGNLVQRVAKLAEKNNLKLEEKSFVFDSQIGENLEKFEFHLALEKIWLLIQKANQQVDSQKPWELSGEQAQESLISLSLQLKKIAFLLRPFLPQTAQNIEEVFTGEVKTPVSPLFPRLK